MRRPLYYGANRAMHKFLVLGFWIVGLCAFFALGSPLLDKVIPGWERFNTIQEEYGLDNALLYYSDLPIIYEAEEASRRAVREGMKARREAAQARQAANAAQADDTSSQKIQ